MATNDIDDHEIKITMFSSSSIYHKLSKQFTILPVNIVASNSVSKKAIYEEKPKAFTDFSADELILSLVSISCKELKLFGADPESYTKIRYLKKGIGTH